MTTTAVGSSFAIRSPPNHWKTQIRATLRFHEILTVLGLDPDAHAAGFSSKEDIYRYVASSRFFDPAIYALDNRNHRSRVRDRKRSTYTGFLEWVEKTGAQTRHQFPSKSEIGGHGLREPYFTDILVPAWPHLAAAVEEALAARSLQKQSRAVLDPIQIGAWTGLSGRDLGAVMSQLRSESPTSIQVWQSDPTQLKEAALRAAHETKVQAKRRDGPAPQ